MEVAYRDSSRYDYDITKVVSLHEINPRALLTLLEEGETDFELPELLFDMDYSGHFCLRNVSVCVSLSNAPTTPTNLGCTLTMQEHKYRISPLSESYSKQRAGDSSRTFDEYAPFEGAGAVSSWKISFPTNLRRFNYGTLTDVVLYVHYTAFSSGGDLEQKASNAVASWANDRLDDRKYHGDTPKVMAISLSADYAAQWKELPNSKGQIELPRINEKFPFWAHNAEPTGATLYITAGAENPSTIGS
ncbi:hypothetical protein N7478_007791 [Penicillium angulare]|uniref:uncharacterized protein n=1 Tax=Penicillium angulare TaxID=116970 RepID=UPI0025405220|nr:uncharacterized protein N7478_007791 [Penicillium angulare]KAJ5272666.1 hypothetical protein N7478_007791 [Penicillium angulare]